MTPGFRWPIVIGVALLATCSALRAQPGGDEQALRELLEQQQQRIEQLENRLETTAEAVERERAAAGEDERVRFGGYGSVRAELTDLEEQDSTFTFRRFVLTGDAQPAERLQVYFELEFERFAELELEKAIEADSEEFEVVQAIEGTDGSEISMEQAWTRYRLNPTLNIDAGALLVPVGRFNINHDDNQWNLPRRSLVDRGVPVLPTKAAWPELGVGVSGTAQAGAGLIDYRAYLVNGAQLDFELEGELVTELEEPPTVGVAKFEAEFAPTRGGFSRDLNSNKALTGRVAFRPAAGREFAFSGYFGQYTPGFMDDETVWSFGVDGLHRLGRFELEYEAVHTDWGDIDSVARSFASAVIDKEVEAEVPAEDGEVAELVTEITLVGNTLAASRTGYWVEVRRPIGQRAAAGEPSAATDLELTLRLEQVLFDDQLTGLEFSNRTVTELDRLDDADLNRATVGISYRPTPRWVVSVAGEYTWTDQQSLAGLTNFIPAEPGEDSAFSLLTGVAFAF